MRITTKVSAVVAAVALLGAPAALAGPNDNPGTSKANARAIAKQQCQEYKQDFRNQRAAFGKCVKAAAKSARNGTNPARSCQGFSKKRAEDQERSDFANCVKAAAQAKKQANDDGGAEGEGDSEE